MSEDDGQSSSIVSNSESKDDSGNKMVSEDDTHYTHTLEGPDDMTSHIKSSLLGSSVSFPVQNGVPQLGVWQGIYLCEHRNHSGSRKIFITLIGQ